MKSYGNLYDKLCDMDNLRLAYKKARKGKSIKWYVKEFEADLENNLTQLQKELISMAYEPMPMKTFVIRDPKTRVISASAFRDRVVHHALCNIIEPIFEKTFISDSYANRKDKGTHAAVKRFDAFLRSVSGNGKLLQDAKDNNQVYGYVLKADIKHYFDSVNHEIMIRILNKKIKDEKMIWLVRKILENHNCKVSGKGMPIGNLTSQFFANVYLNELDYYVKHNLKAKYYIRYVDDFVILYGSKERLQLYKWLINNFLKQKLKIELHTQKSKIVPLHNGVNLLGFRLFYHYKLLKRSNIRKITSQVRYLIEMHKDGIIDKERVLESFRGWDAYALHANAYKFRSMLLKKLNKYLKRVDKN